MSPWFKTAEPRVRFDLEQIRDSTNHKSLCRDGYWRWYHLLWIPERLVSTSGPGCWNLPPLAAESQSLWTRSPCRYRLPSGIAEPVYAYERGGQTQLALCLLKNSNAPKALKLPHCAQCRTKDPRIERLYRGIDMKLSIEATDKLENRNFHHRLTSISKAHIAMVLWIVLPV